MTDNRKPLILYHYTSLENCINIIAEGKIKLSACKDAKNADTETKALKKALKNLFEVNKSNLNALYDRYDLKGKEDQTIKELVKKMIKERENSYMVCFSRSNNVSHLWDKYADGGKGVAMEFDYSKFLHCLLGVLMKNDSERCTGFRKIDMKYDCINKPDKLGELLFSNKDRISDVFELDAFKPLCCSDEEETRILYYQNISNPHLYSLENNKRNGNARKLVHDAGVKLEISLCKNQREEKEKHGLKLKNEEITELRKIFCKDQNTYDKLRNLFGQNFEVSKIEESN